VIVETGDPATAIVNVAARLCCGLVVTGVARDETLGRVLLGTTVDAVVRKSTVPVLVVKSRPRGRYQKVVVATDYSEGSRYAFQATLELLPDSEITLFHTYVVPLVGLVEDKSPLLEAGASQARQGGQEFLATTPAAAGHTIPIVCEHGEIGALLQEFVTTRGIDLVALGATGRGALASILLGNVAQYLLSTLTVDVLVVRHVHPSLQSQA
jgi:nucleotide-binding universal stress UspA family protein